MIPMVLQMNGTLVLQRVEQEKKTDHPILDFLAASSLDGEAAFCIKIHVKEQWRLRAFGIVCSSHNAIALKVLECVASSALLKRAAVKIS